LNIYRVFLMFSFLLIITVFMACGGDDPNNNSSADSENNGMTNNNEKENNNDAESKEEGIEIPDIITEKPNENILSLNDIFEHVRKMDVDWEYQQASEDDIASYSLQYELLDEIEIDGQEAVRVKLIFEDKSRDNYLESEFDYTENGQFHNFEGDLTGEAAEDYDGENYIFQSVTHTWVHLFTQFDYYRTMLADGEVPVTSHESEDTTLGESDTTIHYLETGSSGTFSGAHFSNDKIEVASFNDFELIVNIISMEEEGERTKIAVDFHDFEVR